MQGMTSPRWLLLSLLILVDQRACHSASHGCTCLSTAQRCLLPLVIDAACTAGALGFSTFAVLLYNIFGMFVTEDVGAAARTVLENARTLLVWLVSAVTASFP